MESFSEFLTIEYVRMLFRLVLSICVTFILVHYLYYPKSKRRDFYFTFMMISVAIFFLVFYMMFALEDMKAKTSMGIGIGLFGIFSIMRYRTDTMPVREMTYLFIIIAMSVVNAIALDVAFWQLLVTDVTVLFLTYICEHQLKMRASKLVMYDRIELVKPERHEDLIKDLENRTGLEIESVEVGAIDFLRDSAVIKIHYHTDNNKGSNSVDLVLKPK